LRGFSLQKAGSEFIERLLRRYPMLRTKPFLAVFSFTALVFFTSPLLAQTEEEQQEESFNQPVEQLTGHVGDVPVYSHIYGADFMNEQERCNYLLTLDGMKSKKERDEFRAKHRDRINMLRKERGG
jgi:hypothetical protein